MTPTIITLYFGSHYIRQNSTFLKLLMPKKHCLEAKTASPLNKSLHDSKAKQ